MVLSSPSLARLPRPDRESGARAERKCSATAVGRGSERQGRGGQYPDLERVSDTVRPTAHGLAPSLEQTNLAGILHLRDLDPFAILAIGDSDQDLRSCSF